MLWAGESPESALHLRLKKDVFLKKINKSFLFCSTTRVLV